MFVALRNLVRVVVLLVLSLESAAVFVGLLLQVTPISLAPIEGGLSRLASQALPMVRVELTGSQLRWSRRHFLPAVAARRIDISDVDGTQLQIDDFYLAPSGRDFWLGGKIYLAEARMRRLAIAPRQLETALTPNAVTAGSLSFGVQRSLEALNALREISIAEIDVLAPASGASVAQDSYFLLTRDPTGLLVTSRLDYQLGGVRTKLISNAVYTPGVSGHIDVSIEDAYPQHLAGLSRAFEPLRSFRVPISANMSLNLDALARVQNGQIKLGLRQGRAKLYGRDIVINKVDIDLQADFEAREMVISRGSVDLDEIAANLSGAIDYQLSANGRIKSASADVVGTNLDIDFEQLFRKPVKTDGFTAMLAYDAAEEKLSVERLSVQHQTGPLEATGFITLDDDNQIDLNLRFSPMARADAEALWPVPIAPRSYDWVRRNVKGGRLLDGRLRLDTSLRELFDRKPGQPLPEKALLLDLRVANASLTALRDFPSIDIAEANLMLRGKSFEVVATEGEIALPGVGMGAGWAQLRAGRVVIPDYRARGTPAEISFQGRGEIRRVVRLLRQPPLNLLNNVDFDFDRIAGDGSAKVVLNMPLAPSLAKDKTIRFQVAAQAENVAVDGKLGPFDVAAETADLQLDNTRLHITGNGTANQVPLSFDWYLPLSDAAKQARQEQLTAEATVTPEQVDRLGQQWVARRFKGTADVTFVAKGPVYKPFGYVVEADITKAQFLPVPLAVEKPIGVPAQISATLRNDARGQVEQVLFDVEFNGNTFSEGELLLNGQLVTGLTATPISWGATKNLKMSVETRDGFRQAKVSADSFDMGKLLSSGNEELDIPRQRLSDPLAFLGANYALEVDIAKLRGGYGQELDGFQMLLNTKSDMYERLRMQGVFDDGTELVGRLDRIDGNTRKYVFQSENGSNIFRMFNTLEQVYGGGLSIGGDIYDSGVNPQGEPMQGIGQFTMLGFRAKKVPVLAQLFSLISLTGIGDTLSGDGIKFRKAEFGYWLKGPLLTINDGRMNGPSIGLTMYGDINIDTSEVDLGGTVVPAYSLNNILSNVPLIGPILTGREGEGILGVGYRLTGRDGNLTVVGNPLSVLTPGIFRRIFEVGIGIDRFEPPEDEEEEID